MKLTKMWRSHLSSMVSFKKHLKLRKKPIKYQQYLFVWEFTSFSIFLFQYFLFFPFLSLYLHSYNIVPHFPLLSSYLVELVEWWQFITLINQTYTAMVQNNLRQLSTEHRLIPTSSLQFLAHPFPFFTLLFFGAAAQRLCCRAAFSACFRAFTATATSARRSAKHSSRRHTDRWTSSSCSTSALRWDSIKGVMEVLEWCYWWETVVSSWLVDWSVCWGCWLIDWLIRGMMKRMKE